MKQLRKESQRNVNSSARNRANCRFATAIRGALLLGALLLFLGCATDATQIRRVSVDGQEELLLGPVPFDGPDGSALVEIRAAPASGGASAAETSSTEGETREARSEAPAGAVEAGAAVSFPVSPLETEAPRRVQDARLVADTGATYELRELRFLYADEAAIRYEAAFAPDDLMALGRAVTENETLITLEARRAGELYRYEARQPFYEAMRKLHLTLR